MLKEHVGVGVAGRTEVGRVEVLACLKRMWLEGLKWDTWRYSLA